MIFSSSELYKLKDYMEQIRTTAVSYTQFLLKFFVSEKLTSGIDVQLALCSSRKTFFLILNEISSSDPKQFNSGLQNKAEQYRTTKQAVQLRTSKADQLLSSLLFLDK